MSVPRCRIRRSKRRTVGGYVGGSMAAGITIGMILILWRNPGAASLAAIPLAFAVVLFWMAIAGSGYAPCPACSFRIDNLALDTNDGILCPGCGRFLEGREGYLKRTADNRIADTPLFAVTLPPVVEWPEGCSLCAKPSTRQITLRLPIPSGADFAIDVPYCAEHHGAVAIYPRGKRVRIRFRSYPYFRAFCERNKVAPDL